MQTILLEKLRAYILVNNPDLAIKLQADFSFTAYMESRVIQVMPLLEKMLSGQTPAYIIEELCLKEMTLDLRPSKFNYIKNVIEEEFPVVYKNLFESGIVSYEVINLIGLCEEHFEAFGFNDETEHGRFLHYAVIASVHDYFI